MTEEAEEGYKGSNQREEAEPAKQGGDKVMKAKSKTWSDVAKGLKIDD